MQLAFLFWSTTLCLAPLVLLFCTVQAVLGLRYRGQVARLSTFDATQPVAIAEAVRLKLRVVLRITISGSAVLALGALCSAVVIAGGWEDVDRLLAEVEELYGLLPALWAASGLVLLLSLVATAALLTMSLGYGWEYYLKSKGAALVFQLLVIAPMLVFVVELISGWDLWYLGDPALSCCGLAMVGATVSSMYRAQRAGFCSLAQMACVVCGWLLILLLVLRLAIVSGVELPSVSLPWLAFLAGLLCVPVASVALAPLSLALARNQ